MEKGLLGFVYRNGKTDTTNGGVSSKHDQLVLVTQEAEIFEPSPDMPALYLAQWYGRTIACPQNLEADIGKVRSQRPDSSVDHLGCWMFGGNFVYSCDGRWPTKAPIPVYDRME